MNVRRVRRLLTAFGGRGGSKQRRRVVRYLYGLVGIIVLYTLAYQAGMAAFEGRQITFAKALLAVVESFTTTGYGEDAQQWTTWQMQLFAVLMQFTGVALIFLALPVFLAPWVEERLSTSAPTRINGYADHVVVAGYTARGQALVRELETRDIPYVVVESDRERAADVYETGTTVVHGDPERIETCRDGVNLPDARALVVDVDDETNASIALTAKEVCDVPVITFVEDAGLAEYQRLAGSDQVLSPRRLIGESLATKVTAGLSRDLGGAVEIAEDFDIVELPVQSGSDIAGVTVAESGIRERTGANVIGAWFRGEFVSPPSPDSYIDEQTILLVAGNERQLERLKRLTLSEQRRLRRGRVIVAGYGMVGSTVEDALEAAGISCLTVDKVDKEGVEVVGDVTKAEVLTEAGIEGASTVILALPDDTTTIFATLVVRELAPDIEIIARADSPESVRKLYRAGADYVLSLAIVSGRMLASTILDEEVITFDQQVEIIRAEPGPLAGRSLGEADVRARTGCTVVAVERNGSVVTDVGPDFTIRAGDDLIVAGTDDDVREFTQWVEG
ncbi:potassium channel family protein [Halomarina pelagica]|uniref:potassium channel family protein n=1 Tax=Halomarina pelagica TaxID=2961599 RepID=UPI0020C330D5|nr:NAD-binding protein [Halomarina sp. BND7]